jgi:hypothetical protein
MEKVRIYFTGDYTYQMEVLKLLREKKVRIHVIDNNNKQIEFHCDDCCGTSGVYDNENCEDIKK